ncbi:hypothetical protein [Dankookia sp. P2]|uniref:hypothetical protein n=1 Tax=Dankookia sp. P2 TaxID=3423955 RepID=UPI003D678498
MSQDPVRCDMRAALLTWCFEERIEDIYNIEIYFMSQELATFGYPNLGGASNRSAPAPMAEHSLESLRTSLDHAWQGILLDFRKRLQRQEMHLVGVQTAPERQLQESPIPGQWAADFGFDVLANTIDLGPIGT